MSNERRRHARVVPDDGYFLRCSVEGSGPPLPLPARLLDISPGGVGLQTLAPVGEATALDLSIILPGHLARFRARGAVRWAGTREFGSTRAAVHYAGVRFEAVEEADGRATDWLGGGGRAARDPQRRHPRFRPAIAEAVIGLRGWLFRREAPASVVDLGLGGAQVVIAERIEPGRGAELRLRATRPDAAVDAHVEVRWCRRDTRVLAPRWTAGLAFRGMSPADAVALRKIDRHYLG